ncbi:MAG TPA: hypothetical protein VK177_04375 [Flavobacteriales bacterium]|nr:hypothetical protein [Flavobacteriales bacterium]
MYFCLMARQPKPIPFDFILDELFSLNPRVNPMFGCHAIYVGEKLYFIVRDKPGVHEESNGVWISTSTEHHASLQKEFPALKSVEILSMPSRETPWRMLHKDEERFESDVIRICSLVKKGDPRLGKVPQKKNKKKQK